MPFCPHCRYEYLPEIKKCPDCGAELIDQLPDIKLDSTDVKWVSLKVVPGIIYAKMVAEVLDQKEIPNYIRSLFGSGGMGVVSGGDFPGASARIYVPDNFLKEAEKLQEEMMKDI